MPPPRWGKPMPALAPYASSSTDRWKSCRCCTASTCITFSEDRCGWRERSPPTCCNGARTAQMRQLPRWAARLSGLARFYLGEFLASRAHLEHALAEFNAAHRDLSFFIQDPLVP